MTNEEILNNRHKIFLFWNDPFEGLDSRGNSVSLNAVMKMSVNDCICFMRRACSENSGKPCYLSEEQLLNEFIVVNWAWFKEE